MWLKFNKNFIKLTKINAEQEFRSSFIVVPILSPANQFLYFQAHVRPSVSQWVTVNVNAISSETIQNTGISPKWICQGR